MWSRYGSQPVGAVQHNNPPPGGAWSHAVAAVAAQEDPPPVPGRKHGWGPEGAAQPDPYFDDDETWEDEEQEAGEAYQRSQPGQGDSPRLQGATQGEPDLQPRRGGNNCPGDAPQSSALMQSLFHKSKMEEDAKEARARAAAAHREAEKIQVLEEEIKKFQVGQPPESGGFAALPLCQGAAAGKRAPVRNALRRFQADRNEISRMKNELQVAATSLENEKIAFERQKAAELASLLEEKENAARQHKREKSVLEKQRKVRQLHVVRRCETRRGRVEAT